MPKLINEEVHKLVTEAYGRTKNILQQNKDSLIKITELLLQKEVIFKEHLKNILGKRSGEKINAGKQNRKLRLRALSNF